MEEKMKISMKLPNYLIYMNHLNRVKCTLSPIILFQWYYVAMRYKF